MTTPLQTTKADEIATALEEAIAAGSIPPGTVLRQDELSRRYQVSRTPVREALRRLAALGLASAEPNRGVRVHAMDREEWRDAYLVRAELEGLAAELAAPRITEDDLAELVAAERRFDRCSQELRGDLSGDAREGVVFDWLQANHEFHDVILRASGSAFVARLARAVRRTFSGRSMWRPDSEIDRLYRRMQAQHAAIREALTARSPQGARALSAEHVMDSWRLLELILDSSGHPQRSDPRSPER
jgi:DNA-binding GntR family transcriptional regulator